VFLAAIVVAAVGFVFMLMLKELPLQSQQHGAPQQQAKQPAAAGGEARG
jgi:hypothetical protein